MSRMTALVGTGVRAVFALGLVAVFASGQGAPTTPEKGRTPGVVTGAHSQDKKDDPNLRAVEGTVVDAQQSPVPRAIVQLKDVKTLQIRSFTAQADGMYHFAGLRTDTDYELKAALGDQSSATKRLSAFDSRKSARIILQLEKK
jgi:hypothetical protein